MTAGSFLHTFVIHTMGAEVCAGAPRARMTGHSSG